MNIRKNTLKLLEMVDSGVMDATVALQAALMYMSEAEVTDMMQSNDMIFDDTEEEA